MKTTFSFYAFAFFCLLLTFFPASILSSSWREINGVGWPQPASEVPYPRDYAVGFCIGGKAFLGTGGNLISANTWVGFGDLNEYDPSTNKWTSCNPIPVREQAQGFTAGNKGYIGFGLDANIGGLVDVWEFDTITGSWTQKTSFPDVTRMVKFSFGVNGKGYVGGGSINDLWEFDPVGNVWTFIDTLPFNGLSNKATFSIGTNAYIVGDSMTWKYDALLVNWSMVAPFPTSSPDRGFEILGKGYVVRGYNFYQYDPVTDQWMQKAMLPLNFGGDFGCSDSLYGYFLKCDGGALRYDPVLDSWSMLFPNSQFFNITGKLMTLNNQVYSIISVYDPVTDQWTKDSTITNERWLFALNNFGYAIRNGSFQKYDPLAATWAPLNPPGFQIGLTFALNNKGYSVLAIDSFQNPVTDLYEYDPVGDSWTLKTPYPGGQGDQTIAFTISDKGYLVGGVDAGWSNSPEFWEYDPVPDQWTRKADYPGYYFSYRAFAEEYFGKGYVGLGKTDPTGSDDSLIYRYDPSLDSWSQVTHPIGPRSGTISFAIDDTLYVGRGSRRWSMHYSYRYNDLWAMTDTSVFTNISPVRGSPIQLYPNPANEYLIVSSVGITRISLYNSAGQKLHSVKTSSLQEAICLDVSNLPAGVYFVKANIKKEESVGKIFIRH